MRAASLQLFLFLLPLILASPWPARADGSVVSDYRPVFTAGHVRGGGIRVAIRRFTLDHSPVLLLVDPFTLKTSVVDEPAFSPGGKDEESALAASPYGRLLGRYGENCRGVQNCGAIHAETPVKGMFLTVDMCPSARGYEAGFFAFLAGLTPGGKTGRPVALAVSGRWIIGHEGEFSRIAAMDREGKLAVTWINHSLNHPYDPKAPLVRNFLLTPGVDFEEEIMGVERLLLERGIVPSPFFRFPGLVADEEMMRRLKKAGLIAIGSDAWLAKGESAKNGSIVLVHGNGNEPAGIAMAIKLLEKGGQLKLLPLAAAFADVGRMDGK